MDMKPTKHSCTCKRCGARFVLVSAVGPSNICAICTAAALAAIFGTN